LHTTPGGVNVFRQIVNTPPPFRTQIARIDAQNMEEAALIAVSVLHPITITAPPPPPRCRLISHTHSDQPRIHNSYCHRLAALTTTIDLLVQVVRVQHE
jgi:hypothetical protein